MEYKNDMVYVDCLSTTLVTLHTLISYNAVKYYQCKVVDNKHIFDILDDVLVPIYYHCYIFRSDGLDS